MTKEEILKKSYISKLELCYLLTGGIEIGKNTIRKSELDNLFKELKKRSIDYAQRKNLLIPYKDKVLRVVTTQYISNL